MKKMGTLAGVPDLLFFHTGSLFALELKAKGTLLSPSQQAYRKSLEDNGGFYWTADNADSALSFLSQAGVLK